MSLLVSKACSNEHGVAKQYEVSIPPFARPAFKGKARLKRRFTTPKVARAWQKKIRSQIADLRAGAEARSIGIDPRGEISFVSATAGRLRDADLEPSTRRQYRDLLKAHVLRLLKDARCSELGRERIEQYLLERKQEGGSLSSRHKELIQIRATLRWARTKRYRVDDTAWDVKMAKPAVTKKHVFDQAAVVRFLSSPESARDRAALETAAGTGFRGKELRAFECSWIRWRERRIVVPAAVSKGKEDRSIPLYPRLESVLRTWLGDRREGLVFPPLRRGRGINIRALVERAVEASGVKLGMHALRHHYTSLLIYLLEPVHVVQKILGHKDLRTTQGYTHVSAEYFASARGKLARAFPSELPSPVIRHGGWVVRRRAGKSHQVRDARRGT